MRSWVHRGLFTSLLVAPIFLSGKKASTGGGWGGEDCWGLEEREGVTLAECVNSEFAVTDAKRKHPGS